MWVVEIKFVYQPEIEFMEPMHEQLEKAVKEISLEAIAYNLKVVDAQAYPANRFTLDV